MFVRSYRLPFKLLPVFGCEKVSQGLSASFAVIHVEDEEKEEEKEEEQEQEAASSSQEQLGPSCVAGAEGPTLPPFLLNNKKTQLETLLG